MTSKHYILVTLSDAKQPVAFEAEWWRSKGVEFSPSMDIESLCLTIEVILHSVVLNQCPSTLKQSMDDFFSGRRWHAQAIILRFTMRRPLVRFTDVLQH